MPAPAPETARGGSRPEAAFDAARLPGFAAIAIAVTTHALTPNRNIKVARKNTLDSSVTFDEYQNIMVDLGVVV